MMNKKTILTIIAVCSAVCFLLGAGMFFLIDSITDSKIEQALSSATADQVSTTEAVETTTAPEPTKPKTTEEATKPTQKATEKVSHTLPYVGRYYDSYNSSYIEVTSVGEDYFIFNGFWNRIASVKGATAYCDGSTASFNEAEMNGKIYFSGVNTMEVVINSDAPPGITNYSVTFKYQNTDQGNQTQTDKYVNYLTGWRGRQGFVKLNNTYDTVDYNYGTYGAMRFYSDGTVKYSIGHAALNMVYEDFTAKYRVETTGNKKSVLYIGNDAYDITDMYAGGYLTMTIEARGNYRNDLSGKYNMAEHYLFENY